jgi:hypothetical protein
MKLSSLSRIQSDLDRALSAIVNRTEYLAASEWLEQTPPSWSVQKIVMHLTLAAEQGNAVLKKRLVSFGPEKAGRRSRRRWRQRLSRLVVFNLGRIPFRANAPEMVRPDENLTYEKIELLSRYQAALDDAKHMAESVSDEAHAHVFLPHFAFGDLTLAEWIQFMRIHAEHHGRQIDRLRR